MSKVAISGDSSGTGTFTIKSPNSNTDRTLNLPDSAGTLATAESTLTQFNASGSAPVYACRAWVRIDALVSPGAILGSGNVSSVTTNATGDYTINFATAMTDSNYSFVTGVRSDDASYLWSVENPQGGAYSTTALRVQTVTQSGSTTLFRRGTAAINVAVFR